MLATPGKWLTSVGIGAVLAFLVCVVVLALTAYLIAAGTIDEGSMGRWCGIALLLGCLVGGFVTAHTMGSRVLLCALAVSVIVVALWAAIGQGLFGRFGVSALLRSLVCALLGGMGAGILAAGGKKSRN